MACVRKRRGVWVCDYRDHLGIRRTPSFSTKELAQGKLAEVLGDSRERSVSAVDPDITVEQYAERWLALARGSLKRATLMQYEATVNRDIIPALGAEKIRKLRRASVKTLLLTKLQKKLARNTVRLIHATLRTMLSAAVDDELIRDNPARGLSRVLRLAKRGEVGRREVKALDEGQLRVLLDACRECDAALYPLVLTLAHTGIRPGEAYALRWDDVDLGRREIHVSRALSAGAIETPKTGESRSVDIRTAELLRSMQERALQRGAAELVFPAVAGERGRVGGGHLDHHNVAKRFKRLLRDAKLPQRFTLYCLRHTFASTLLAAGESLAYVQEQMGHASPELTASTYGRWLRKRPLLPAGEAWGEREQVVAVSAVGSNQSPQVGDPARTRTLNPEIKSESLEPRCQNDHDVSLTKFTCEDTPES